jgi:hypothetical protein
MADAVAGPPAVRITAARAASRWLARLPWSRRRREYGRLALTELDIRRLDERIDALLDVLAQLCDYSGQPETAREFRALTSQPAPAERVLRLVRGQQ